MLVFRGWSHCFCYVGWVFVARQGKACDSSKVLASNGGAKLDVPAADGTLAATAEADEPAVEDLQGEGTIPSHRTVDTETGKMFRLCSKAFMLCPPL